jgi:hypothetical protein
MKHWTQNLEEGRRIFRYEMAALDTLLERKKGLLKLIESVDEDTQILEGRIQSMAEKIYTDQEIFNAKNPLPQP